MSAPSAGKRILSVAVFIAALYAAFVPVYSETLSPDWTRALSAVEYFKHVRFLASDDLRGRGNGSPELQRASVYFLVEFTVTFLHGLSSGRRAQPNKATLLITRTESLTTDSRSRH